MEIYQILQELNKENGSNYKIKVLQKYNNNELLKRVLRMTYDTVAYTYGITMKNIEYTPEAQLEDDLDLEFALYHLESDFATREVTGNDAWILGSYKVYCSDCHKEISSLGKQNHRCKGKKYEYNFYTK